MEIRGPVLLPARREEIELETLDGLTLVGELALPAHRDPVATLVTLHPLPTAGGFMDSHILRKAAGRLPALADLAVLRFNTRGTTSPRGTSEGAFDGGRAEEFDVAAALAFVEARALPHPWLVGWSFGTELALKYGRDHAIDGVILLSPPLHRATAADVAAWRGDRQVVALIPEFDDYLRPPRLTTVSPPSTMRGSSPSTAASIWVGRRRRAAFSRRSSRPSTRRAAPRHRMGRAVGLSARSDEE
jgi:alpha/beta superfamily hydrolase